MQTTNNLLCSSLKAECSISTHHQLVINPQKSLKNIFEYLIFRNLMNNNDNDVWHVAIITAWKLNFHLYSELFLIFFCKESRIMSQYETTFGVFSSLIQTQYMLEWRVYFKEDFPWCLFNNCSNRKLLTWLFMNVDRTMFVYVILHTLDWIEWETREI